MTSEKEQHDYWDALSGRYRENVLTPFFSERSTDAFFAEVDRLRSGYGSVQAQAVLDAGCGKGFFLNYFLKGKNSHRNSLIAAVDSSEKMLHQAADVYSGQDGEFSFLNADIRSMPFPDNHFGEVYAVNSILDPFRSNRFAAVEECFRITKQEGLFVGLFPAAENLLEQVNEIQERLIAEGMNEDDALKEVYRELVCREYDPVGGYINTNENLMRIKLFLEIDCIRILKKTGYRNVQVKKFSYPPEAISYYNLTAFENRLFDWLVIARKP